LLQLVFTIDWENNTEPFWLLLPSGSDSAKLESKLGKEINNGLDLLEY
jgi:hypothetical protein